LAGQSGRLFNFDHTPIWVLAIFGGTPGAAMQDKPVAETQNRAGEVRKTSENHAAARLEQRGRDLLARAKEAEQQAAQLANPKARKRVSTEPAAAQERDLPPVLRRPIEPAAQSGHFGRQLSGRHFFDQRVDQAGAR
jgi:hypothetical protein